MSFSSVRTPVFADNKGFSSVEPHFYLLKKSKTLGYWHLGGSQSILISTENIFTSGGRRNEFKQLRGAGTTKCWR